MSAVRRSQTAATKTKLAHYPRPSDGLPASAPMGAVPLQALKLRFCEPNNCSLARAHTCRAAALFAAALIFCSTALQAQNWTATIQGTMFDPSGAIIPGASVSLRNPATGEKRDTRTSDVGFYSFPLLPVGTYELEFFAPGFVKKSLKGLTVQVGQTARMDVTLKISAKEFVVIDGGSGSLPMVETASPAIADEIDNRRVTELPLNGRQFSQLALLAAGAVPPYPNGATQQFNTAALGIGFSVNGQRSERNNFSLDGITLMEPFAYSLTVNPSVDAVREFRVVEDRVHRRVHRQAVSE